MKQKGMTILYYGLLFFMPLLWLTACGNREISFSTANIADARLTKDEAGTQATTTFNPEDPFYLIVNLANAPDSTTVKAEWTAVSVAGADPNTLLDDVTLTSGDGTLTFDLSSTAAWPVGEYKVDLYLNDELDRTLDFRVRAGLAQEPVEQPADPEEEAPELSSGAVATLEGVRQAVIQIEAQGTFVDPQVGTRYNVAGSGSGFIIEESGIAVTNNHVVTGAALLRVWLDGESQPRNARVLGVSECADLAIIDIEGDGFSYLEWFDGNVDVGLDVYAAGFPLGDPEYTLTRGIVSKARTDGRTNWASVANVIEHDATINPGNSGGPLVTSDGKVVAVNYAGASSVGQFFAIAQPQALPVIEQMRQGNDVLSLGINGTAVLADSLSGIWVSSVKSGSPADRAGVRGGDILTRLEGLILATDGTMADYCDILRSRSPEDTLALEVLRFETEEVLEGQINGRELELSFSFAQQLGGSAGDESGAGVGTADTYANYTFVNDNSGLLSVEIPVDWADVDGSPWTLEGEVIGLSVTAAPNINDFNNSWTTPGVFFGASEEFVLPTNELLDLFDFADSCQYSGRDSYEDPVYAGVYDLWADCGGTGSLLVVVVVEPADGSYTAFVLVQVVSDADLDALDRILDSFIVN
ncbi:MAG: trypsin-like peptidase domain-containing protein [Chloroflexota bacterium]